mmetsp:Transcript_35691/g.106512  ORF Transcript_35691/g.106512 Transcript_35691/m.106512 type:complete len:96 (+) Transcript_35691:76-363(+)
MTRLTDSNALAKPSVLRRRSRRKIRREVVVGRSRGVNSSMKKGKVARASMTEGIDRANRIRPTMGPCGPNRVDSVQVTNRAKYSIRNMDEVNASA